MSMKTETRISKYLARAGLASRRDAEKLLISGRVSINGIATKNSWESMKKGDIIALDGVKVTARLKDQLFIFNTIQTQFISYNFISINLDYLFHN